MDMLRLHQARPDVERRQRRDVDAEDDATEMEVAPVDLYGVLGYHGLESTVTTQQWLSVRCISF